MRIKSGGRLLSVEGVGVADEGFGVRVGLLFVVAWFLVETWKLPLDEILTWLDLADVSFAKDDDDGVFLVLSAATIGAGLADGLGILIISEAFFVDVTVTDVVVAVAVVFLGVDGIATDWLLTGFHDLGDMAYT